MNQNSDSNVDAVRNTSSEKKKIIEESTKNVNRNTEKEATIEGSTTIGDIILNQISDSNAVAVPKSSSKKKQ